MGFIPEYPVGKVLVSIMQATDIVGVSCRTIYNWLANNKIDYCRTASGSIRIVEESLFSKDNVNSNYSKNL